MLGSHQRHGHTHLSQVIEVILVVHPLVVGSHAVRPVGDVPDVNSQAVVELALEELQEGNEPISIPCRVPHGPWDVQKLPRQWLGWAARLLARWSMTGREDHQCDVEHRLRHC